MGFLSDIFGYDSDMPKYTAPQLDEQAQEFQDILYPRIQHGLIGGGLTPEADLRTQRGLLAESTRAYEDLSGDLGGMLARTVQTGDESVKSFIRNTLETDYARTQQGIRDEFAMQRYGDIGAARNMAFTALSGEKELAGSMLNAYNESSYRRTFNPDFESTLLGGLGGAGGILAGGWQSKTNNFTKPNPNLNNPQYWYGPGQAQPSNFSSGTFSNPMAVYGSPEQGYAANFSQIYPSF